MFVIKRKGMLKAQEYKGIEFVRLKDLPVEEKAQITNWANPDIMVKIQTEDELLGDCILYKDYHFWRSHIYTEAVAEAEQSQSQPAKKRRFGLALNNH